MGLDCIREHSVRSILLVLCLRPHLSLSVSRRTLKRTLEPFLFFFLLPFSIIPG